MTCDEATDLVGPYVDDDLPYITRRRVEEHLLGCQHCAWEAQTLRIMRDRLRDGIGEFVASDAFRSRLLARLRSDNPHLTPNEEAENPGAAQYRLPIST
jgi:anti-sigma factor RsiW